MTAARSALRGIHHVTAIAGDPHRNRHFYGEVLGLRFIKKTVNFDDPFTYHFYFGDSVGTPGTALTFFVIPEAQPGQSGVGAVDAVAFNVPVASLDFWRMRLERAGVAFVDRPERWGESGLALEDPDGLRLELVACEQADPAVRPWTGVVRPEAAIRGFHGVTARVARFGPTDALLCASLGFRAEGERDGVRRYATGGAAAGFYDLVADGSQPMARAGRGSVHHIAWATGGEEENLAWRDALLKEGRQVSPLMNRLYFHSIYFREPGGVLFEMATQGPGFAIDEAPDALGTSLRLPPEYESRRHEIESVLPPTEA